MLLVPSHPADDLDPQDHAYRVAHATHGQDLLYLSGEFSRLTYRYTLLPPRSGQFRRSLPTSVRYGDSQDEIMYAPLLSS